MLITKGIDVDTMFDATSNTILEQENLVIESSTIFFFELVEK